MLTALLKTSHSTTMAQSMLAKVTQVLVSLPSYLKKVTTSKSTTLALSKAVALLLQAKLQQAMDFASSALALTEFLMLQHQVSSQATSLTQVLSTQRATVALQLVSASLMVLASQELSITKQVAQSLVFRMVSTSVMLHQQVEETSLVQ